VKQKRKKKKKVRVINRKTLLGALLVGECKARGAEVSVLMTLSTNAQAIKMFGEKKL
jgi:hypothetical protein